MPEADLVAVFDVLRSQKIKDEGDSAAQVGGERIRLHERDHPSLLRFWVRILLSLIVYF